MMKMGISVLAYGVKYNCLGETPEDFDYTTRKRFNRRPVGHYLVFRDGRVCELFVTQLGRDSGLRNADLLNGYVRDTDFRITGAPVDARPYLIEGSAGRFFLVQGEGNPMEPGEQEFSSVVLAEITRIGISRGAGQTWRIMWLKPGSHRATFATIDHQEIQVLKNREVMEFYVLGKVR